MLGAIIGDIAGSKYEFNNLRTEDFIFMGPGGDYTDDTICTVAVAEAAMTDQDYASHLQKWCRRDPHPTGSYGGNFSRWIYEENPEPYGSYGNGAPMRVSSIGWLFETEKETARQARNSDAVRKSIIVGGDSDTIGAITGSLAEAYYGIPEDIKAKALEFLPKDIIDVIDNFNSRL